MKLLLAEDTRDLNRAISAMLTMQNYQVDSVFDGEEALHKLEENGYDAIILDIMMPRRDGLSVLKELRERGILTPVLMLTAKAEIEDRVLGLDSGADDYLTKPFAMKELVARVGAMTRRRTKYSSDALTYGDITLKEPSQELTSENTVRLSVREMEVLQNLILNQDRDLSADYLLEHVWSDTPEAAADMVWLYINYLRGKLRAVGSSVGIAGSKEGPYRLSC